MMDNLYLVGLITDTPERKKLETKEKGIQF